MNKRAHLICNAHIDPVWQWEWEEGAAAAVSTFRAAADFCEEFDDFVFCHNEALLYRWIEEYEPELFARIRRLVRARTGRFPRFRPSRPFPKGRCFSQKPTCGPTSFPAVRSAQLRKGPQRVDFASVCSALSASAFSFSFGCMRNGIFPAIAL